MIELFNELAVIGEVINENDRVVYMLASLPESYDVLVTALEAVSNMEMVIDHEERSYKNKTEVSQLRRKR
jgi:hypothetical protein